MEHQFPGNDLISLLREIVESQRYLTKHQTDAARALHLLIERIEAIERRLDAGLQSPPQQVGE